MPKGAFSKIIVVLVIALNIIFTGIIIYVFLVTGSEPETLIRYWYSFTMGELFALAGVKITKVRKGGNDNNDEY